MKISKISGVDSASDWLSDFALPNTKTQKEVVLPSSSDVSPLSPESVDDTVLAFECDKIEKCASENRPYFYNKSWGQEHVSSLKEYATICGMGDDHFVAAEHKEIEKQETIKVASSQSQTKDGEKNPPQKEAKLDIGDAFRFDEKIAKAEKAIRDWQVNTPAQKLELNPVMTGGIVPVRGGENYFIQNNPKLASNQNSLANPDAIGNLVNSDKMDNGARLAKEREDKLAQKQANKKQWEQDIIDSMVHKDIVAKGKVFPTEMLNAQPGLSSPASQRIAGKFDPEAVPERTAGEKIKEQNEVRKASISRPKEDSKWQGPEDNGAKLRGVSDIFGDALKKALGK